MPERKPVVASQFYPGQRDACLAEIDQCLRQRPLSEPLPETIVAGIVPHAGWAFSGDLAAMVFAAVKQIHEKVDTFCILGAAHGYFQPMPALYESGSWITPLGQALIDGELAAAVLAEGAAVADANAHGPEHSIEVQLPFIKHLFPDAKILPIIAGPNKRAIRLGERLGDIIARDRRKKIVCIGSTDLTHYGPRYGFTPAGMGPEALKWATCVNDQQFIDMALKLDPHSLLANAVEKCNACGAGAAAATITAAKTLGKTEGVLLAHTNSNDVMLEKMGTSANDAVGYTAIVF